LRHDLYGTQQRDDDEQKNGDRNAGVQDFTIRHRISPLKDWLRRQ